jgi:predicted transposase YbfD/YdcC
MIACVQSGRQIGESAATARRFHVSPARLTAEAVAKAAGTRWLIGNSLHRVPDLTFDEDRARNRKDNGAENRSLLRKLTLTPLRKARRKLPTSRQTQTRRTVRRRRKIHHRPNAMALHQPTARVAANGTEG